MLFSVNNPAISANELIHDLSQGKMNFNPELNNQATEELFSCKKK